jgi:ABC-type branched-subunit amino acid transport system substrate-binding protein
VIYVTDNGGQQSQAPSPVVAASVNAAGGIHGRPLKVVECQDHYNANQTTQCARQAVANPNTLAVIGNTSTCGSQLFNILAAAHMASFGDSMSCPESFTSPAVFAFDSISLVPAAVAILGIQQLHNKNVAAVTIDVPIGAQYPPEVEKLVAPYGGKVTGVLIPMGAADMAPYAAKIVASNGFMLQGTDTATAVRLYKALQQQGYNQPILFNPTTWNVTNVKQLLGNPTNAYIETPYDPNSAGWKAYIADLKKYDPSNINYGEEGLDQWLAAHLIAEMANKMASPSASKIFGELSKTTALQTLGLTPPLDYTKPANVLGGLVTRPISPCLGLYKYDKGQLAKVGPFVSVLPSAGTSVDCAAL